MWSSVYICSAAHKVNSRLVPIDEVLRQTDTHTDRHTHIDH